MSLEFYRVMHLSGLMFLFLGLGGVLIAAYSNVNLKGKSKILALASHGMGLVLLMIGGFGMLAKLGMAGGMPKWVYLKLGIWIFMAIAIMLARKRGQSAWSLTLSLVVLGSAGAYLAINKPF